MVKKARTRAVIIIGITLVVLGVVAGLVRTSLHQKSLDKNAIYGATCIRLPDGARIVRARCFPYRGPNYVQVVADVTSVDIDQLLKSIPRKNMYDFYRYDKQVPSPKDSSAYEIYEAKKGSAALGFERAFDPGFRVRNPKPGKKFIYAKLYTKAKDNKGELIYLNILIQPEKDGRWYLYLTGDFD
ncbi:MAG TPA: hypothetical protein VGK34_06100 [Armatimonadota bacterium]